MSSVKFHQANIFGFRLLKNVKDAARFIERVPGVQTFSQHAIIAWQICLHFGWQAIFVLEVLRQGGREDDRTKKDREHNKERDSV